LATNTGCFAGRMTPLEGRRGPDGGAWLPEPPGQLIATDMAAIRSQSGGWVCCCVAALGVIVRTPVLVAKGNLAHEAVGPGPGGPGALIVLVALQTLWAMIL
jgi:hypothetical protein